ncbi:16S rRNA pseudouridine516 synthase [Lachnospiraceae bacterium KH1T2]|nr:16S rRNA pseudouridine516 synthase [Lachnospiraceae bacterium KH1T2]
MRLDKFLADMNIGTRSEIKKMIRKGLVTVNNEVIKDSGVSVTSNDEISFNGELISYQEYEYIMLNKPAGVISASEDKRQETVIDLLDERHRKDLFPVGRLDKDTVGLLLITNDGQLAHDLLSPAKHVDKLYRAKVTGALDESDVKSFAQGIKIDDEFTSLPARLKIISSGDISEAEVTIREGKFHQIKRMFSALGHEVTWLKRVSMGPLTLDESLKEGEYRVLTTSEITALKGKR